MAPAQMAMASNALLELLEGDVPADAGVEVERDAQPLDQPEVHLDGLARQAEGGHADEHRAAREGQLVVHRDLVARDGQLARDREARGAGADHGDGGVTGRDDGHVVRDAGRRVPLHEEALHGPDGERPVDVAPAAGTLAGRRADVGAHRRDRVGLAGQDVPLLEAALGGEVQVAAAVRAHRARFLALDVALQPGRVDRLDEELLIGVDDHAVRWASTATGLERALGGVRWAGVESTIRRPVLRPSGRAATEGTAPAVRSGVRRPREPGRAD